jgi:lysophospholipase L1-like esterase
MKSSDCHFCRPTLRTESRARRLYALWLCLTFLGACSGANGPSSTPSTPQAGASGSQAASGESGTTQQPGGGAESRGGTSGSSSGGQPGTATSGAPSGGSPAGGGASGGINAGGTNNGGSGGANGGTSGGTSGGESPTIAAGVRWVGRVDVSDPADIKFAWSGSGFVGKLTGPEVSVKLRTHGDGDIYFQPVVDGTPGARFSVAATDKTVSIATALAAGEHQVELYRESEGKGLGYSEFLGFVQGTPGAPPAFSGRLIEVIGDSISAGYGNLGTEQHVGGAADPNGGCHFTTETESAYKSYSLIAARALGADASVLAGSGWGTYSDGAGDLNNVMPRLFPNTLGEQATPAWSFQPKPQAVIINLGTNDSAAKNLTADKFKPAYAAFVATVRQKDPSALILFAIGSMLSGTERTNALQYLNAIIQDRAATGDTKVKLLDLGNEDATMSGCDWHPSAADHQRMADIMAKQLKADLGW